MATNIKNKAQIIADSIIIHSNGDGDIYDLGSSGDGNAENLHNYLKEILFDHKSKIISIDNVGNPDILADLNGNFPMANESVGTIIASEIIEHLDNPLHFLKECKRILKSYGCLVLTTPNALSLASYQEYWKENTHNEDYGEHLYCWHRINLENLIRKSGFKIADFKYISCHWNKNILFRFFAWLIPIWRPTLHYVLVRIDDERKRNT